MMPFFELVPRVRWITFPNGSHMVHLDSVEALENVLTVVGNFLRPGENLAKMKEK